MWPERQDAELDCQLSFACSIQQALDFALESEATGAATMHPSQEPKRAKLQNGAIDEGMEDAAAVQHHVVITGSLHLVGGALARLGCGVL